jgi:hypothetical protein
LRGGESASIQATNSSASNLVSSFWKVISPFSSSSEIAAEWSTPPLSSRRRRTPSAAARTHFSLP